jgi:hypothetical protein
MTKREILLMGVAIALSVGAAMRLLQQAEPQLRALRESAGSALTISSNFPNWASLMIAAIAGAVLLIGVILGLVVLFRPRRDQEGLYP